MKINLAEWASLAEILGAIAIVISLFLFTTLAGRLWCGWGCPQTVFTDVFAGIARRIQGWRGHAPPRDLARWRVVLTHAVWFVLCGAIAFHLVGYFHSPYDMLAELGAGGPSGTTLTLLGFVTIVTYVDFAFIRQDFCRFLCPYARFQGVLFDRETLVIGYDTARGEPRGKQRGKPGGDCVDCSLCVQVCPSKIDIRDGLQLDCIACTQCIDACDDVMHKLGREPGLIAYRALSELESGEPAHFLRPRVLAYAAMLAIAVVSFAGLLATRKPLDLQVLRNRSAVYGTVADGRASNAFTLHIQNRSLETQEFEIAISPSEDFELVAGINPISVQATEDVEAWVFVLARPGADLRAAGREIEFSLQVVGQPDQRVLRATRFLSKGAS